MIAVTSEDNQIGVNLEHFNESKAIIFNNNLTC